MEETLKISVEELFEIVKQLKEDGIKTVDVEFFEADDFDNAPPGLAFSARHPSLPSAFIDYGEVYSTES